MNAPHAPETVPQEFWSEIDRLTGAGALRRLSGVFARFIGSLGHAGGPLMLATVVLSELEGRGHSCLELADLASDPAALLGWEAPEWRALAATCGTVPRTVKTWREALAACEPVWCPGDFDFGEPLVLEEERLYLRRYWRDEALVADSVRQRARTLRAIDAHEVKGWLDVLFASNQRHGEPPDWQRLACAIAVRGRMAVITGGPGTGKTYTVARLLALLFALAGDEAQRQRIALAAPTGKAAARLKQSIEKALGDLAERVGGALPLRELTTRMGAARTLHSLLGARPDTRAFAHNRGNPLDVDVLIVDEASMVHLEMMAALLDALPTTATLILLGDKDQLASVEAGAVLGDLCHDAQAGRYTQETLDYAAACTGESVPPQFAGQGGPLAQQTVMLRHSRRFGGPIGQLALAVNDGDTARAFAVLRAGDAAVQWQERASQQSVVALAMEGYRPYLDLVRTDSHDAKPILQAFEAFRILCAVRDGEWGVEGLNAAIEAKLQGARLLPRGGEWYAGRPVMVTRNDYGTGVFNGDIGLTLPDPQRPGSLRVYFLEGDTVRSVLATRLRHVETAYAMTVHKSQGSEFRHTVMVLPRERSAVITRELIYTGITRASQVFTLMSSGGTVLEEGIVRRTQRASGLRGKLA
ncbi:exodeoxyribonuclease V subunit alpha [Massilia arenosa]|uniref:RecBCD enzyme subunit RecD n=1 Tax=Zemynaea arenosa TaxID=2561931 RepID=A0A4Y9SKT6_9BURK|nr:exodeoxyribonuclease V subunit alpha [Massilia arenosa]TFW22133.1 exodeoxyribonuclease V subunit alpha [Massilia arenosa]